MTQDGAPIFDYSTADAVPIKKLDAAVSQLETALVLWFHDQDPSSVFTLAFAAHEVFRQIAINKKLPVKSIKDPDGFFPPAQAKFYRRAFENTAGFFKHGGNENEVLHLMPMLTMWFLTDSIKLHHLCGFSPRPITSLFSMWLVANKPSVMGINWDEVYGEQSIRVDQLDWMRDLSKQDTLKEWLKFCGAEGVSVLFHNRDWRAD